ncbi:hypothetical protein F0U59_25680 [Archangium gephyra]|nr:hypothetical protein F0U59_25680 [Archangium gephyra]
MPTLSPTPPPASRSPSRWRRPLLWGLGVFLVLEVILNGLLATGLLEALINRSAQSLNVEWDRAWSVWPDSIQVRALRIRNEEAGGGYWELAMESAELDLSPFALLGLKVQAEHVDVEGLSFRLHPGDPGARGPKGPGEPPPWELQLKGVRVHGVRELAVGSLRLTGVTDATGEMALVPGHRLTVNGARVRLGEGELTREGNVIAHVEKGTADFDIDARRDAEGRLDVASGLGGRLQVSTTLPSLTTFQRWVPQLAEAELEGGAGRLEADVRLKEGRFTPDSRLEGSGSPIVMPLGLVRVRAPWRLHGEVRVNEDGASRAGLRLVLSPVKLEGKHGQLLETSEATVSLNAPAPRLGEPPRDVHAALHVAASNPLELRALNGWLAPAIQVESGQARLVAVSHADAAKGRGKASLELSTDDVRARWGGTLLGARLVLDVDARKMALHRDTVTFAGSRLLLRNATVQKGDKPQVHGWEGTLSFPEATLALSPALLSGRFAGSFTNAAPFVALLTDKTGLPQVLSPLLEAKNLELSGTVSLGSGGVKMEKLHVQGEGLELRGKVELSGASTQAVMLVKVRSLPLGVEVTSEGVHLQILHPTTWYEQKLGERVD